MAEAIQRMYNIIEELLTMSRIMTNQIDLSTGPTNLQAIVRKVIQSYEPALRERQLSLFFDETQWPTKMRSDDELIRLAVSNLLSNAIKYTPDGGMIHLTARVEDEYVRFSVRDTGIGIDPADQRRIFERFHTLRDVSMHTTSKTAFGGGGLGLGLAISKGIIEAHGGHIWVESLGHDPQRLPGSEFIVLLPLATPGKSKPASRIKRLQ
jgi:signal transduction histidine kinase